MFASCMRSSSALPVSVSISSLTFSVSASIVLLAAHRRAHVYPSLCLRTSWDPHSLHAYVHLSAPSHRSAQLASVGLSHLVHTDCSADGCMRAIFCLTSSLCLADVSGLCSVSYTLCMQCTAAMSASDTSVSCALTCARLRCNCSIFPSSCCASPV